MTVLVSKAEITNFIPQRKPIVMIDSVICCEEMNIETTFEIQNNNIFLIKNKLSESGLLENIAQSAAAKVGYECHEQNIPVPLGFIGAISKIKVFKLPLVGQIIHTYIDILREVFDVTIVRGLVKLEGEILIECEMKIIIASETDAIH